MRRILVILASLLVGGCGTVPRYKEPRGLFEASSVSINRWSVIPTCKYQGLPGPNGQLACEAKLLLINKQRAFQANTRLALGEHNIVLSCVFGPPTPMSFPIPMNVATITPVRYNSQQYTVRFTTGAHYRLEAYWEGEICSVRMLDAATGEAFPLGASRPFIPPAPAAKSE